MTNRSKIANMSDADALRHSRSFWYDALAFILRDRLTMFAISVLVVFTLICVFMPMVFERVFDLDGNSTSIPNRFKQPGQSGYPLGTDQLGRNQFLRLIYGGRVSIDDCLSRQHFDRFHRHHAGFARRILRQTD